MKPFITLFPWQSHSVGELPFGNTMIPETSFLTRLTLSIFGNRVSQTIAFQNRSFGTRRSKHPVFARRSISCGVAGCNHSSTLRED